MRRKGRERRKKRVRERVRERELGYNGCLRPIHTCGSSLGSADGMQIFCPYFGAQAYGYGARQDSVINKINADAMPLHRNATVSTLSHFSLSLFSLVA